MFKPLNSWKNKCAIAYMLICVQSAESQQSTWHDSTLKFQFHQVFVWVFQRTNRWKCQSLLFTIEFHSISQRYWLIHFNLLLTFLTLSLSLISFTKISLKSHQSERDAWKNVKYCEINSHVLAPVASCHAICTFKVSEIRKRWGQKD